MTKICVTPELMNDMCKCRIGIAIAVCFTLYLSGDIGFAQERFYDGEQCPPGTIKGGLGCERRNLCKDGHPPDPVNGCAEIDIAGQEKIPRGLPQEQPNSEETRGEDNRHACEEQVLFYEDNLSEEKSIPRTLLISNGPVAELLLDYFLEIKQKDLDINYSTFKVYFFEPGRDTHSVLSEQDGVRQYGFWDQLRSVQRKDYWLQAANERQAVELDDERIDELIDRFRSDALCGR